MKTYHRFDEETNRHIWYTDRDIENFHNIGSFLIKLNSCLSVAGQMTETIDDEMALYEASFLYKRIVKIAFGHIKHALFDDPKASTAILSTSLEQDIDIARRFTMLLALPLFANSFRPRFSSSQLSRLLSVGTIEPTTSQGR
jgi:hypothetical protein